MYYIWIPNLINNVDINHAILPIFVLQSIPKHINMYLLAVCRFVVTIGTMATWLGPHIFYIVPKFLKSWDLARDDISMYTFNRYWYLVELRAGPEEEHTTLFKNPHLINFFGYYVKQKALQSRLEENPHGALSYTDP